MPPVGGKSLYRARALTASEARESAPISYFSALFFKNEKVLIQLNYALNCLATSRILKRHSENRVKPLRAFALASAYLCVPLFHLAKRSNAKARRGMQREIIFGFRFSIAKFWFVLENCSDKLKWQKVM